MKCNYDLEDINNYVEGNLSKEHADKLSEHLSTCNTCNTIYKTLVMSERYVNSDINYTGNVLSTIENYIDKDRYRNNTILSKLAPIFFRTKFVWKIAFSAVTVMFLAAILQHNSSYITNLFKNISTEIVQWDNSNDSLGELPQKDIALVERMALRCFGADMPALLYASDKIAIITDYWGIVVYDLENERICRAIDLIAIDMSATQGDFVRLLGVNPEGTHIIIKKCNNDFSNTTLKYIYDIKNDSLEVTDKEDLENYASNFFDTSDEKVKNSLNNINLDGFHYQIAQINENKWIGLKCFDENAGFFDMRALNLYVFEYDNVKVKQVFAGYDGLEPWPYEDTIKENYLYYMNIDENNSLNTGFVDMTPEQVMQRFRDNTNWEYIGEGASHDSNTSTCERYHANLNTYDVLIDVWSYRLPQENISHFNIQVVNVEPQQPKSSSYNGN